MSIQKKWKCQVIISVVIFLVAFFGALLNTFALTGVVSGEDVNFRTGAGINYNVIEKLKIGTTVTVKNAYAVYGSGCSEGWISISYNNRDGYICKTYLNIAGMASYQRPWSSPKKAILGGAEFIASSYISAGQFNSYLKKFNVNPNSSHGVYNHQYMANLAAPYSEASSTYRSYRDNNLLSLPLEFTIPIFDNMPEYTTHPVTGAEKGGTSEVLDQNFEQHLNNEGFDETYKKWLRVLHKSYPNWVFKSLRTGLDFNTSVEREKWISSINGASCPSCKDPSNTNTEGNWYIGSSEVTAYFLDPRNFLMVDSVLMFENLGFSENYQESVVKTVLNGSFMSGVDPVDHVAYSSIFMEAGRTYRVNPVYLAALSRQEVGANGSISTSGERIDYKGNTYLGFYNFYNIGAYSSEESPVKAGIVYAAAGASKNAEGVFVGIPGDSSSVGGEGDNSSSNPSNPGVLPLMTHLSNMKLTKKGNYLTNVSVGTTVGTLKSRTKGNELAFRNSNNVLMGDSERVGTGTKITFPTGETYEIVLYGDLTGDGLINSADLLRMRQILLGQVKYSGAYLESARLINVNGNVNSADLLRLRQYLLGQKSISQS